VRRPVLLFPRFFPLERLTAFFQVGRAHFQGFGVSFILFSFDSYLPRSDSNFLTPALTLVLYGYFRGPFGTSMLHLLFLPTSPLGAWVLQGSFPVLVALVIPRRPNTQVPLLFAGVSMTSSLRVAFSAVSTFFFRRRKDFVEKLFC